MAGVGSTKVGQNWPEPKGKGQASSGQQRYSPTSPCALAFPQPLPSCFSMLAVAFMTDAACVLALNIRVA